MTEQNKPPPFKSGDVIAGDAELLATRLAHDVAEMLQRAIDQQGRASLVVSGGSTPRPFLNQLSALDLAWEQVTVTLADERWVAPDHADSNDLFVHTHLLRGPAAAATFVSMKNNAATPEQGWDECEAAIKAIDQPFDVTILGMGGDGHTASLFPYTEGLMDAIAPGCGKLTWPIRPAEPAQPRMSLTLDALLASNALLLHITGIQKQEVYGAALTAEPATYPIAAVIKNSRKLQVYWSP